MQCVQIKHAVPGSRRIRADDRHARGTGRRRRHGARGGDWEKQSQLDKLQEDIGKSQEKVASREKYINNQVGGLIQEYSNAQAKLRKVRERHKEASGRVTEKTRVLAEISEELEKVKQEIEEKSSSMSDGAPVVQIKQALMKLRQETEQMDVRIGVVQHSLLQAKLKEKSNMPRDMHHVPDNAAGPFN